MAIVLFADQGSGKTSLRELMSALLGERMVHHTSNPAGNSDVLHADFNSALKYKLFIEFEEINMRTHSKMADGIKALVTDNTHMIKHKGQEPISVKASERFLFTTNSPGSIVVEQGDRRYCTLSMSQRRIGDAAYWKEFYSRLRNDNFIKDVADYLCSFRDELVDYEFGTNKPLTKYYEQLKALSFPPELEFLKDTYFDSKSEGEMIISSTQLSSMFNTWREEHSMEGKTSNRMFSMRLKTHGEKYGISSKHTKSGNVFVMNISKLREQLAKDLGISLEEVAED